MTDGAGRDQPGGPGSTDELLAIVYDELRRLARSYLRDRRPPATMQTTALVHEAYLRLSRSAGPWESRAHFLAVAARAMRQILSNHVRALRTAKRGGAWTRVGIDRIGGCGNDIDIVALDEALEQLAALDRRQCSIVECRLFAGMSMDEIAGALGVSLSTVEREWRAARAWLSRRLAEPGREANGDDGGRAARRADRPRPAPAEHGVGRRVAANEPEDAP